MSEEKCFSIHTDTHSVARIALAWEITKFIYLEDSRNIPPGKIMNLYKMVEQGMSSDKPMDQEAFKKLHDVG